MGGMTFSSLFKRPETTRYPFEKKPAPEGLKGHIENEVENCILCGICEKTCPADAIQVDKQSRTWTINPFLCVQCSSCARECPKKCLVMLPTYTPVSTEQSCTTIEIPDTEKEKKSAKKKEEISS